MTDGYAINFLFARKKASDEKVQNIQLDLEDFTASEIHEHFQPVAVDPGRNQIFTACYGSGQTEHQVRRMLTTEYYTMTGSSQRNKTLQKEKRETGFAEIDRICQRRRLPAFDSITNTLNMYLSTWKQYFHSTA